MSDPYPVYVNDPLTGAIRSVQPSIPQRRVGQEGTVTARPTLSKRARFERAPKTEVVIDKRVQRKDRDA